MGRTAIFWETETTAAQRDGYSPPCSSTIRTARVRTSGENLFVVLLIRLYPTWELEPPTVPVRFSFGGSGAPIELVHALIDHGAKDLVVVNNNAGTGEVGLAALIRRRR